MKYTGLKIMILLLISMWVWSSCEPQLVFPDPGPIDIPTDTTKSHPPYIGPPVVSNILLGENNISARWRPVLRGENLYQFVDQKDFEGIIKVRQFARLGDSLAPPVIERIFAMGGPPSPAAFRTTVAGPLHLEDFPQSWTLEMDDSVRKIENCRGCDYSSDPEGTLMLATHLLDDTTLVVLNFDLVTHDTSHLFRLAVHPSAISFSMRKMHVTDENNHRIVYAIFSFHQKNIGQSPAHIFRYDLSAGRLGWIRKFDVQVKVEAAQILGVGDSVVLMKGWRRVIAYDRITGVERWRWDQDPNKIMYVAVGPVLAGGGRFYFFEDSGDMIWLDQSTGRELGRSRIHKGNVIDADPWTKGRYIFVSSEGMLNLFNPLTNEFELRWKTPNSYLGLGSQHNWDSFHTYPERGLVVAQDRDAILVYDLSGY